MTAIRVARVYGEKAKEALQYSKVVAEEDAKVAVSILAEDLLPLHETLTENVEPDP